MSPTTVQCPPHSTDRPDCAPTTTTQPEPTTTTVETTTTAVESTTTAGAPSTSVSAAGSTTIVEVPTTAPELPATGGETILGTLGLVAVVVGAGVFAWARRRTV